MHSLGDSLCLLSYSVVQYVKLKYDKLSTNIYMDRYIYCYIWLVCLPMVSGMHLSQQEIYINERQKLFNKYTGVQQLWLAKKLSHWINKTTNAT